MFRPLICLHQLRVHRQREKELSALSRGLEGRTAVAQHLQRWQSLLTAHSLELAELINNLDEEAAADIRKVHKALCASSLCLTRQVLKISTFLCIPKESTVCRNYFPRKQSSIQGLCV